MDAKSASKFGGALRLCSSRLLSMIATAGHFRVANIPHKMAPPVELNFIAHSRVARVSTFNFQTLQEEN